MALLVKHPESAACGKDWRPQSGPRTPVSPWPVGTPSSWRHREKPPDLKINSASGIIVRFPQSRSNLESNPVLGLGGDAWGGPQCGMYTRLPHVEAFFRLQKKEKKIRNKRQSRVCLGAFIPQRKDRCAHCPALGSYDRVSAEPQPRASSGHNGGQPLRAWVFGPGYGTKCVWPLLGQT